MIVQVCYVVVNEKNKYLQLQYHQEVTTVELEGKGKIIASKEIKGERLNILFEEASPNAWVVKRKNVQL